MSQLTRGAIGTIALNVTAAGLNFGLVLTLSRRLGASGFGAYASAFAWAGVLAVVAVLGLAPLVIRHVASYEAAREWGLLRGLLRRSVQSVSVASLVTITGAAAGGLVIYGGRPELLHPFLVGLLLVPLVALTTVRQSAMQGLGRVVLGRLPETVVVPTLAIVLILVVSVPAGDGFTPAWALFLVVAATTIAFAVGTNLLRRSLPPDVPSATPVFDMASWRRSGIALIALNVAMAANAQIGTIALGLLGTPSDAGIFNVAQRATVFVSFLMLAAAYPMMPLVARLYATGEIDRLRHTVVRAARLVAIATTPIALGIVLLGPQILSLFGQGFEEGSTTIRILAIGEVVNVLTGFGGLVLVMCARERDLAACAALGTVVNIALTAALVPALGVEGAAIGTSVGVVSGNLLMSVLAWRRLGVWAPVIPLWRRQRPALD